MKILIVSMRSLHTIRWVSQLKDSGHEIHYFDILNGGYIKEWDWVEQHTNWRYKLGDFKGRYLLKKYLHKLHVLLENNVEKEFEKLIDKIKPDVVHSFVMYKCCVPIFPVMKKHSEVKWIYSSWGSDLYYFRNIPAYEKNIRNILPHIDYLFTDTKRDAAIAQELGFSKKFLGVFPGGGGFPVRKLKENVKPFPARKTILIKGYQGRSGRAINVLKAILQIKDQVIEYHIVIFGADKEVIDYLKPITLPGNFEVKSRMSHAEVLKLMGEAVIYIGNSNSDGMPNTLLEAIIMGAFPIQSNPGGATAEIIEHGKNGLLIQDAEDVNEIKEHLLTAISLEEILRKAFLYNQELKYFFDFEKIKQEVLIAYSQVEKDIVKC